ncbi:poly-gamma-glutamate synthase PgsB [Leptospira broomii serovar Hurstbridge str. 5399]|uniref:Poly-gamma-glutamate synthase PgsB n=1 Tax=Leptospira broomii serovar Hurstbridge str. 5399 TaxID=1049789 RepID=T0G949_9LEPT|nr:poly-gamma-glutamate synthase PgsB [Leptospira broomii]EQA43354.1 poly-gamma-glutamate synthase PgsB [Leptospira broomii serovar Hurstbridge str. 5399]
MIETEVLSLLIAVLIFYGWWEYRSHRQILKKIPIRIHVNGTRGKSSVTRLISAGLREAGIRTLAKTTGTLPRVVFPDGDEKSVYRAGRANILEQTKILRLAAQQSVEAVVLECMALDPQNQWISENRIVQATHMVITNIGEDHLEIMGPKKEDVALALGATIPPNRKLFTSEREFLHILKKICLDRGTELIASVLNETEVVTDEDLRGFSYYEHRENVNLALRVCDSIGVDRQTALRGMQKAIPDLGATAAYKMDFFGRQIYFVNGFAANDPASSKRVWELARLAFPEVQSKIAIVNCRPDRPDRSLQLGTEVGSWGENSPNAYLIVGTGTHIFGKGALDAGVPASKLHFAEDVSEMEIFEMALALGSKTTLFVGIGNIGGLGLSLVRTFKNRSEPIGLR